MDFFASVACFSLGLRPSCGYFPRPHTKKNARFQDKTNFINSNRQKFFDVPFQVIHAGWDCSWPPGSRADFTAEFLLRWPLFFVVPSRWSPPLSWPNLKGFDGKHLVFVGFDSSFFVDFHDSFGKNLGQFWFGYQLTIYPRLQYFDRWCRMSSTTILILIDWSLCEMKSSMCKLRFAPALHWDRGHQKDLPRFPHHCRAVVSCCVARQKSKAFEPENTAGVEMLTVHPRKF